MRISVLMENTASSPEFIAEHGLSLYIETSRENILFDTGQTGAFAENAEKLGINLADVDFAVISHGHYDHGGGLRRFLELNDHAPVYIRSDAFDEYYHAPDLYRGLDPALKKSRQLVFTGNNIIITPGLELHTCNGMTPEYPTYNRDMCKMENGHLVPDSFRHEQYLMIREFGKRVLISGCSHKGVLNLMKWLHPDILIGGFHFKSIETDVAGFAVLDDAAAHLMEYPAEYYTGHCTGTAQFSRLKQTMGDRLHAFSSGQVIELET